MMSQGRRILLVAGLTLSVLFLPYWFYLPALFIAVVLTSYLWEAIPLGFLIDVIYGGPHSGLTLHYPFALAALVLVLIMIPVRKRLRLHA